MKTFRGGLEAPLTHAAPYSYRQIGATVKSSRPEIASHQSRGGQRPGVPKTPPRGEDNPAFREVQGTLSAPVKHLLAQNARGRGRGG
jgi:hypothetical protein